MSFLAQEQGIATGSPQELYEIVYAAQAWYYTSGDAPFFDVSTSRTYEPLLISRNGISFSSDFDKGGIEVEVQRDAPFLELFRIVPPSGVVALTIKRVHRTDVANEIAVIWKGRMLNVEWDVSTATITCESIRASVKRYGLRRCFQLQCTHALYGPGCGVSRAEYEVLGVVGSMSANIVTVAAASGHPDNYFAGGYIEWVSNAVAATERRSITSSVGGDGQLELAGAPVGMAVGSEVRVYPGCDHTLGENGCQRFNNVPNYGGFPYTPSKNPFSGEPMY